MYDFFQTCSDFRTEGRMRIGRTAGEKGQALLEVTLMAPLILLLFAATVNIGFYTYALICTENAARAGALHASMDRDLAASANLNQLIRGDVCGEMKALPNVGAACPT